MKKVMKKVVYCMLAIGMIASVMLIPNIQAKASTVPAKVHAKVMSESSIRVNLAAGEYKITNLKSSSKKNLIVRDTYVDSFSDSTGPAWISVYANKKGKYKVSFDVVDRNNKVKNHHVVQVFAISEPVTKVTIGGKAVFDAENSVFGTMIFPKAAGKLKVKMTKGYSIKSIEVTTYDKSGSGITKIVKNGKKIKLSQYRYKYVNSYYNGPGYESWSAGMFASTCIRINYIDKYTNEEGSKPVYVYRFAKN